MGVLGLMKEKPILFNTDMVKAILEGRKTQTRRIVKEKDIMSKWDGVEGGHILASCPYGQGDRLWVRETWYPVPEHKPVSRTTNYPKVWYKANNDKPTWGGSIWKPSIFMPRKYSRITLKITGVEVERVQDINQTVHDEVLREGWPFGYSQHENISPVKLFERIWDSINGKKYPWSDNPWVWVISFKKVD